MHRMRRLIHTRTHTIKLNVMQNVRTLRSIRDKSKSPLRKMLGMILKFTRTTTTRNGRAIFAMPNLWLRLRAALPSVRRSRHKPKYYTPLAQLFAVVNTAASHANPILCMDFLCIFEAIKLDLKNKINL